MGCGTDCEVLIPVDCFAERTAFPPETLCVSWWSVVLLQVQRCLLEV